MKEVIAVSYSTVCFLLFFYSIANEETFFRALALSLFWPFWAVVGVMRESYCIFRELLRG